jgi:4-alpha-glucanotransferase
MAKLTLLLALHNHQPEGNFDHVFRRGYDDCYRPVLDLIAAHPRLRLALHHSGTLLEWLDANQPAYLTDLRALVERGQVEVLGGGFYEPMLAVLPEADAQGQLALMSEFCAQRLGARPRGMWLAERVWEPALAETIARAGLGYTLVDDTHFRYAGMGGKLDGYYVTEKAGAAVAIFPIAKELRYAIPFMQVHETMQTLDTLLDAREGRDVILTYGDDGEKFGLWPETKAWVWDKGWLAGFFSRLEGSERVVTARPSDVLATTPASGRAYLPTASYEEMGEWALPPDAQQRYHEVRARLEAEHRFEDIRPFFRGGVWQAFLAKYPEANFMHKKMIWVSRKLAALPPSSSDTPDTAGARRDLYRAQCNCAYWHGLFGGLYLNYLRHAVYARLIAAEAVADRALGRERYTCVVDFDADLAPEVVLANPTLWVGIKPGAGGAFFELDARAACFQLANVLGRHPEAYHAKLREALRAQRDTGDAGQSPRSIHHLAKVKDPGLEELLHYDRNPRLGLIDHFLAPGSRVDELARSEHQERGDFAGAPYALVSAKAGVCELSRHGRVGDAGVTVDKTFRLEDGRLSCRWRLRADPAAGVAAAPIAALFVPELSLTLLAGDDAGRRYEAPGLPPADARMVSRGALEGIARLDLVDEWSRLRIALEAPGAAAFWRFPLETASQSEGGFERTYQGSVIAPVWTLSLEAGATREIDFHLTVSELQRA